MTLNCPSNRGTMHPPAHVCRQLYKKYPDLRLAWHGLWGKFCVVRLSPKRMTMEHSSAFIMFGTMWDIQDELDDHGNVRTVGKSYGPVFSKDGIEKADWDRLSTDVLMQAVIENVRDVFNGAVVKQIQYQSRNEQKRAQAKVEHEKGKMLRDAAHGYAEDTANKARYYLNRHDGLTTNMSKKHMKEDDAANPVKTETDLEYYHIKKRGLQGYL